MEFAAFVGLVMTYYEIAAGGGTPDPYKLTETITSAAVGPLLGMLLMVPDYAVALIGTFVRSFAPKVKGGG